MGKQLSPSDYSLTDSIREWAARRHGAMFLPDVYLQEWVDGAVARGSRYASCEQALRNWINWDAPGGRFHKPLVWEQQFRRARAMERQPARSSTPAPTVAGQYVVDGRPAEAPVAAKPASDVARAALASALALAKS